MALAPDTPGGVNLPGRARNFAAARSHSRFVRSLKFVIPAASILAVLALLAWSLFNPFARLPGLSVGPISISGSKIAMENPRLTGFRKDNRSYEVLATTAYQDIRKPNVIELHEMKAKMATDNAGGIAHLVSRTGVFDSSQDHLDLKDEIRAWTNKGEEIFLKSASVNLKTNTGFSKEPVKIKTPTLTVEAGAMEMADNGQRITFTGRVRTVLSNEGSGAKTTGAPKSGAMPMRIDQANAGGEQ